MSNDFTNTESLGSMKRSLSHGDSLDGAHLMTRGSSQTSMSQGVKKEEEVVLISAVPMSASLRSHIRVEVFSHAPPALIKILEGAPSLTRLLMLLVEAGATEQLKRLPAVLQRAGEHTDAHYMRVGIRLRCLRVYDRIRVLPHYLAHADVLRALVRTQVMCGSSLELSLPHFEPSVLCQLLLISSMLVGERSAQTRCDRARMKRTLQSESFVAEAIRLRIRPILRTAILWTQVIERKVQPLSASLSSMESKDVKKKKEEALSSFSSKEKDSKASSNTTQMMVSKDSSSKGKQEDQRAPSSLPPGLGGKNFTAFKKGYGSHSRETGLTRSIEKEEEESATEKEASAQRKSVYGSQASDKLMAFMSGMIRDRKITTSNQVRIVTHKVVTELPDKEDENDDVVAFWRNTLGSSDMDESCAPIVSMDEVPFLLDDEEARSCPVENIFVTYLGDGGSVLLGIELAKYKQLLSLIMPNCGLITEDAIYVSQALEFVPHLRTLNLCGNPLGAEGTNTLLDGLRHVPQLRSLYLHNIGMGSLGAIGLSKTLLHVPLLERLLLGRNNLNYEGIQHVSQAVVHIPRLIELDLQGNGIGSEGAALLLEVFHHLPRLEKLSLRGNPLNSTSWQHLGTSLRNNPNLCKLWLGSRCGVKAGGVRYLSMILLHKPQLVSLSLKNNGLAGDVMKSLGVALKQVPFLRKLDLSGNALNCSSVKHVCAMLESTPNLLHLYMDDNKVGHVLIKSLAHALSHVPLLKSLHLNWNMIGADGLKSFAQVMPKNENIRAFHFSANQLGSEGVRYLSLVAQKFPSLEDVDISFNEIGHEGARLLAPAVEEMVGLRSLNVAHNLFTQASGKYLLRAISPMMYLRYFYCHDVDVDVGEEPSVLSFVNQSIHTYDDLPVGARKFLVPIIFGSQAASLQFVLGNGPPVSHLELSGLALDYGILLRFPWKKIAQHCTRIELGDNAIRCVPVGFGLLQADRLEYLGLARNPFCGLSARGVRKYLEGTYSIGMLIDDVRRMYREDPVPCTRLKLMVVGAADQGKTTLLRRLVGVKKSSELKHNEATDGVDLSLGTVELEDITLTTWDFGGQYVYRYTHQLFLTDHSLYLLVFDLRAPPQRTQEDLLFWCHSICSRTSARAAVALVGTHAERLAHPKAAQQALRLTEEAIAARYPDLISFCVAVDSLSGAGYVRLREELLRTAKHVLRGQVVPRGIFPARMLLDQYLSLLHADQPPVCSYDECLQALHALGQEIRAPSLEALDMLGEVVIVQYLGGVDGVEPQSVVVLKPQWLTRVFSSIVTVRHRLVASGILEHRHLKSPLIWGSYPEKLHPPMLALLEQCDVAYRMPSEPGEDVSLLGVYEGRSLVPCLLPALEPSLSFAWPEVKGDDESGATDRNHARGNVRKRLRSSARPLILQRVYRMEHVPAALVGRTMANLLPLSVEVLEMWQDGCVCELGCVRTMVRRVVLPDGGEQQLEIRVRSIRDDSQRSSRIVCSVMRRLHVSVKNLFSLNKFFGLPVEVAVPCECQALIAWSDLETLVLDRQDAYDCSVCNKSTPLRLLAPDLVLGDVCAALELNLEDVQLVRELGSGAYGRVYEAETQQGTRLAIKELTNGSPIASSEGEAQADMEAAAEAAARDAATAALAASVAARTAQLLSARSDHSESAMEEVRLAMERATQAAEKAAAASRAAAEGRERARLLDGYQAIRELGVTEQWRVYVTALEDGSEAACYVPLALRKLEEQERANKTGVELLREFRWEVWLMSSVKHASVVRLLGFCLSPPALAMEVLEGGDVYGQLHDPFGWGIRLHVGKYLADVMNLQSLSVLSRQEFKGGVPSFDIVGGVHWYRLQQGIAKAEERSASSAARLKEQARILRETARQFWEQASRDRALAFEDAADRLASIATEEIEQLVPLTWPLRIAVAMDVASGMTYLHSRRPSIVHRDLKTPNIFLTHPWHALTPTVLENLTGPLAKVADLGISARLFGIGRLEVVSLTTSSRGKGSLGLDSLTFHSSSSSSSRSSSSQKSANGQRSPSSSSLEGSFGAGSFSSREPIGRSNVARREPTRKKEAPTVLEQGARSRDLTRERKNNATLQSSASTATKMATTTSSHQSSLSSLESESEEEEGKWKKESSFTLTDSWSASSLSSSSLEGENTRSNASASSSKRRPRLIGLGADLDAMAQINPTWAAPEVLAQQEYGREADVYAMGMVLWELLTRKHPFHGIPADQVRGLVIAGKRPKLPPETPEAYAALIRACWAPSPTKRPSFAEILLQLNKMRKSLAPSLQRKWASKAHLWAFAEKNAQDSSWEQEKQDLITDHATATTAEESALEVDHNVAGVTSDRPPLRLWPCGTCGEKRLYETLVGSSQAVVVPPPENRIDQKKIDAEWCAAAAAEGVGVISEPDKTSVVSDKVAATGRGEMKMARSYSGKGVQAAGRRARQISRLRRNQSQVSDSDQMGSLHEQGICGGMKSHRVSTMSYDGRRCVWVGCCDGHMLVCDSQQKWKPTHHSAASERHEQRVVALVHDCATDTMWSGSEDGVLRVWASNIEDIRMRLEWLRWRGMAEFQDNLLIVRMWRQGHCQLIADSLRVYLKEDGAPVREVQLNSQVQVVSSQSGRELRIVLKSQTLLRLRMKEERACTLLVRAIRHACALLGELEDVSMPEKKEETKKVTEQSAGKPLHLGVLEERPNSSSSSSSFGVSCERKQHALFYSLQSGSSGQQPISAMYAPGGGFVWVATANMAISELKLSRARGTDLWHLEKVRMAQLEPEVYGDAKRLRSIVRVGQRQTWLAADHRLLLLEKYSRNAKVLQQRVLIGADPHDNQAVIVAMSLIKYEQSRGVVVARSDGSIFLFDCATKCEICGDVVEGTGIRAMTVFRSYIWCGTLDGRIVRWQVAADGSALVRLVDVPSHHVCPVTVCVYCEPHPVLAGSALKGRQSTDLIALAREELHSESGSEKRVSSSNDPDVASRVTSTLPSKVLQHPVLVCGSADRTLSFWR